jgi:hypothetical protein
MGGLSRCGAMKSRMAVNPAMRCGAGGSGRQAECN